MPHPPQDDRLLIEVLAAGIAHEVRNPLNALQINAQILEQELEKLVPDRRAHVFAILDKIGKELRSLDNFVAEFLRYARPPPLKTEQVNLPALLVDLATFIGPECSRKKVALSVRTDKGPRAVRGDGFQLKHVLLNLILNGMQAMPQGGTIALESGGTEEWATVTVRDDGEGIAEEIQPRLFELFFTTREGGTGLGLPIARRIVEAHGGSLRVESRPGRGTTATVSLPVHHEAARR